MINSKILGVIGLAMKAGKICFGADSVEENIEKRKVKLLIIAEDSSERTKNNATNHKTVAYPSGGFSVEGGTI